MRSIVFPSEFRCDKFNYEQFKMNILFFLPTYNESFNAVSLINKLVFLYPAVEILVIDDGSTDGTLVEIQECNFANVKLVNRGIKLGIGSAHFYALNYARENKYEILVTLDADGTHNPEDITYLLDQIRTFDIVVGSRFIQPKSISGWNLTRLSLTHLGHMTTKFGLGIPYDCSSGFRAYNISRIAESEMELLHKYSNYDFFYKSLYIFSKQNIKIGEVAIKLNARLSGKSKMSLKLAIIGIARLLFDILKFRFAVINFNKSEYR